MHERAHEFDVICTALEDEALNSGLSATLISSYLKKHLGYDRGDSAETTAANVGTTKLIFEHDIFADGV